MAWRDDLLPGFSRRDIPVAESVPVLGEPADTELVATLVRRDTAQPSRRAVLYVHGWNDYFFQTHLAKFWADRGFDFYAVDLRRYGRSWRQGQLAGYITDLAEYDVELSACLATIRAEHDTVVLSGHSTGGLITALWAADHPGAVDGLVLNSPWLDLQATAMMRALGRPVVDALGTRAPTTVVPQADSGFYSRVLHVSREGEWDYDLTMKTSPSQPVRAGWLRAVLRGHQRVARGLGIEVPVLVMASERTVFGRRWSEEMRRADTVLDVNQIAGRAPLLGRCVTVVRIKDGLHDLVLSPQAARQATFSEMARWLRGYLS